MSDIVVSLGEEPKLELRTIDIGLADNDRALAFTVEGVIRGLESNQLEQFVGTSVIPSEIHFRIESD